VEEEFYPFDVSAVSQRRDGFSRPTALCDTSAATKKAGVGRLPSGVWGLYLYTTSSNPISQRSPNNSSPGWPN
jgi:hypothetical protein